MSTQETNLKAIADAIRAKEGTEAPIPAADFPARIAAIQTGTDTSDATAAAGDILAGKTAYGASGKLTGTIPSKGESDLSVSGPAVTVPAGHYPAQVSKSVAAAEQATRPSRRRGTCPKDQRARPSSSPYRGPRPSFRGPRPRSSRGGSTSPERRPSRETQTLWLGTSRAGFLSLTWSERIRDLALKQSK